MQADEPVASLQQADSAHMVFGCKRCTWLMSHQPNIDMQSPYATSISVNKPDALN